MGVKPASSVGGKDTVTSVGAYAPDTRDRDESKATRAVRRLHPLPAGAPASGAAPDLRRQAHGGHGAAQRKRSGDLLLSSADRLALWRPADLSLSGIRNPAQPLL